MSDIQPAPCTCAQMIPCTVHPDAIRVTVSAPQGTPTSVEEAYSPAVQQAFDWAYTSGIDAERAPKYLRALIATVRAEERAKVNRLRTAAETLVRTWSRYPQNEHESLAMHELKESLAGLAKMENP